MILSNFHSGAKDELFDNGKRKRNFDGQKEIDSHGKSQSSSVQREK